MYTEHLLVQSCRHTESIQEMYAELHWNSSQKTNRKKKLSTVKYVYVYIHKYFLKIMTLMYIKALKLLYIQRKCKMHISMHLKHTGCS